VDHPTRRVDVDHVEAVHGGEGQHGGEVGRVGGGQVGAAGVGGRVDEGLREQRLQARHPAARRPAQVEDHVDLLAVFDQTEALGEPELCPAEQLDAS
jgi:hypothetical protein